MTLLSTTINETETVVSHEEIILNIDDWRVLLKALLADAQDILHSDLLFGLPAIPQYPTETLSDQVGDTTPGRSFIDDV